MKKKLSLILLSVFLVACVSNDTVENKKLIPISSYLDLTMKHGKKLPLMRQRMLFNKYWKMKSFKMNPSINRPRKAQSGCVQLLVAVSEEGKMTSYGILKSYPEGVYDEHVIRHFKTRRWEAAEKNIDKTPVLTTMQMNMIRSGSSNRAEASKECEMRR